MKYIARVDYSGYGSIIIEAETAEQARELLESGEWKHEDINYKGGDGLTVIDIDELE